ncbi:MAG: flagellar hook-basal body complex protein FliE [Pseudomonadota bacterium]|jgi:flagellar hook-basal body complex protein FliE
MTDAISSVLSQIRALQAQAKGVGAALDKPLGNAVATPQAAAGAAPASFGQALQQALGQVNQTQLHARDMATAFELGDPRADLARVMVAQQQASVAFRATVEVRNRLVQAYQDVMNMPL